jgi:ribonuclease HII
VPLAAVPVALPPVPRHLQVPPFATTPDELALRRRPISVKDAAALKRQQREEAKAKAASVAKAAGRRRARDDDEGDAEVEAIDVDNDEPGATVAAARGDAPFVDTRLLRSQFVAVPVVKGDGRCPTIAAASVLAKVERDRVMVQEVAPAVDAAYGLAHHKGYPTAAHLAALAAHGATPYHRRSFRPVATALEAAAKHASAVEAKVAAKRTSAKTDTASPTALKATKKGKKETRA